MEQIIEVEIIINFGGEIGGIFLWLGITFAIFICSGKMPVLKDWLIVVVIASIRGSLICCNNFVNNPSGPVLCLGLRL